MRILQGILFVIGATILGTTVGFLALVFTMDAFRKPGADPFGHGMGQLVGGMLCGAPFGGILGLIAGIIYVRSEESYRVWGLFVWLGILIGFAIGLVVSFTWSLPGEFGWLGRLLMTLSCTTAGGMAGGVGDALYRSAPRKR